MPTEPNTEIYIMLLSIAGAIILILVTVIVWASKRLFANVSDLLIKVSHLETLLTERDGNSKAVHEIIDFRLNAHSQRISDIKEDIVKIKTKLDLE